MKVELKIVNLPETSSLADLLNFIKEDLEKKSSEETSEELNMLFFINRLAEKRGTTEDETNEWLAEIEEVSPIAAFNIILKEIALYLDEKYEGHIKKCSEVYTISSLNGTIVKVFNNNIKSFKNFSAFRTMEDAKFACHILKDKLRDMFSKNAKKEQED